MIRIVDTDMVVKSVAKFLQIGVEELWVAFGTGKNYRHIEVHKIVSRIGTEKSQSLAFSHAFTGCDTVSFFSNRGKKSAWQAWQAYPEATDAFHALCSRPPDVPKTVLETLERFVVLMYDRTSEHQGVDAARSYLFSKKSKEIKNILPTAAALLEHTKRAAFQAGHIWGQCLVLNHLFHRQVLGVGRGVMDNGELYGPRFLRPPRLATSCSTASARRPARGTASVTGQTCSAIHCALAMASFT